MTVSQTANGTPRPFFEFQNVCREFTQKSSLFRVSAPFRAVDGVSFTVNKGETVGLVGESGCEKSTLARMAVRLLPPTGGDILLEGISLFSKDSAFLDTLPSRIQMVFQYPFSSLNPRMRIGESVGEALKARNVQDEERNNSVAEMLAMVGLRRMR
jgi:ABC-type glutathione transport system ATPase component